MASEPHRAACPPGAFPRILNMFPENGVLRARRAAKRLQQSSSSGLRASANLGPLYGQTQQHYGIRLGCLGFWKVSTGWMASFAVPDQTSGNGTLAELFGSTDLLSWSRTLLPSKPGGIAAGSYEESRNDVPSSGKGECRPQVVRSGVVRAALCEVPTRIGPRKTAVLFSVPTDGVAVIERHPRLIVDGSGAIVRPILPPFTPDVWESGTFAAQPVYATFPSFLRMATERLPGSWTIQNKDSQGNNQTRVTAFKWHASLSSDPNAAKEVTEGVRVELSTSALKGDYCQFVRGTGDKLDLSRSEAVVLLTDPGESIEFWDCVALELVDGSGRRCRVYDARGDWPSLVRVPNSGKRQPCSASSSIKTWDGVGPEYELVAIPVSERTEMQPSATDLSDVRGLRIVCTNVVERSPGLSLMILAVCAGGRIQGGATFACSFASSMTSVESPAVELPSGGGTSWSNLGASLTFPFDLAETDAVGYSYSVPVPFPSAADARSGADRYRLYLRPRNDVYAYLMPAEERTLVVWDANDDRWETADGQMPNQPLSAEAMATFYVRVDDPLTDAMVVAPDEQVREAPTFQAACFAQNRTWLGSGDRLYVSDYGEPHRFREAVRFLDDGSLDELSGCVHEFPGERILGIHATDGPQAGTNRVFVLTDAKCYLFDGAKPAVPGAVVGRWGAWSAASACTHRDALVWASESGDVRAWINGGLMQASDGLVGDWFETASSGGRLTDPGTLWACSDGRRVWFCSDAGVLAFDPEERWWVELQFPEAFEAAAYGGGTLAAVSRFGEAYQLETASRMDEYGGGSLIRVELSTPLVWSEEIPSLAHGSLALACDEASAVTVTPLSLQGSANQYGWPAGYPAGWLRVPAETGASSPAVGWTVSAEVGAGWALYGLAVDVERTLEGS